MIGVEIGCASQRQNRADRSGRGLGLTHPTPSGAIGGGESVHADANIETPSGTVPSPNDMIAPDRVLDLKGTTREAVLDEMIEAAAKSPLVGNRKELREALFERERSRPTGVGMSIAMPHVKIPSVKDFVITIGRSFHGVDFDAMDHKPAHIIVMVACNDTQAGEFLKLMAKLAMKLKERDFQRAVLMARNPDEVCALFREVSVG